jgi:transglutaminase-like putative cysteine protease
MRLETRFRLSLYLTLAAATLGLCSAERHYIPETRYFLVATLALLGVAYAAEGRWALSAFASNLMGLLIAFGAGVWVVYSLMSPASQVIDEAPYPAALLPFGGPVLMLVMVAKLFRPKRVSDYWALHVVGLIEVALGCILAGEPAFGFWLGAYLACGLWSLSLFWLYRQALGDRGGAPRPGPGPWRAGGVWFALRLALAVGGAGLFLFLLTPRHGNERWNLLNPSPPAGQMETGFSQNKNIDLTPTGPVKVSEEVALEVFVADAAGNPKAGLGPEQRWRGTTLENYERGRWQLRYASRFRLPNRGFLDVPEGSGADLPDLGPDRLLLTYHVELQKARGLVLAEPVASAPDRRLPVCTLSKDLPGSLYFYPADGVLLAAATLARVPIRYQQALSRSAEAAPAAGISAGYRSDLIRQPLPRVRALTEEVLHRLAGNGRLAPADIALAPDAERGPGSYVRPEKLARVARALSDYLATSGDYVYRLEMRRSDLSIDPTEDFLCNVKRGFCEHFATGLALMLRSVGIPSRVVNGFRGAEPAQDEDGPRPGWYVIRHSHAHSWVEALVPRPGAGGAGDACWLTLDPTPAAGAEAVGDLTWEQWWLWAQDKVQDLWRGLIIDYTQERQTRAAVNVWGRLWAPASAGLGEPGSQAWGWGAALGTALAAGALAVGWRWRRRHRTARAQAADGPPSAVGFYDRWLRIVARHARQRPQPSQTPWEFAGLVGRHRRLSPPAAGRVAGVCRHVVGLYYRVRYGRLPLDAAEHAAVERQLDQLEVALRGSDV